MFEWGAMWPAFQLYFLFDWHTCVCACISFFYNSMSYLSYIVLFYRVFYLVFTFYEYVPCHIFQSSSFVVFGLCHQWENGVYVCHVFKISWFFIFNWPISRFVFTADLISLKDFFIVFPLRFFFLIWAIKEFAKAIYVVPTGVIAFYARVYYIILYVCSFDIHITSMYSLFKTYSQISFSKLKASVDSSALPIFFFFFFYFVCFVAVLLLSTFAYNSSPCVSIGTQNAKTCDRDLCGNRQIESTHYFIPSDICSIVQMYNYIHRHNCWAVHFGFIWRWSDISYIISPLSLHTCIHMITQYLSPTSIYSAHTY